MPNLRRKKKALIGLGGLLEIAGFEVTTEGIRTSRHRRESWKERVADFMGCIGETVVCCECQMDCTLSAVCAGCAGGPTDKLVVAGLRGQQDRGVGPARALRCHRQTVGSTLLLSQSRLSLQSVILTGLQAEKLSPLC